MFRLVVFFLALSSSGSNKHRYTILFDENSSKDVSDGIKMNSWTSKDLALKGRIRNSMVFKIANSDYSKNMVCSPVAAYLALAKLGFGASRSAKEQIERALGDDFDRDVQRSVKKILSMLTSLPGGTLSVGSRIYVSNRVKLKSSYIRKVEESFKSSIVMLDFDSAHRASTTVNSWVSSLTQGIINYIVKPSDLTPQAVMMIVNAIYFRGKWDKRFDPAQTKDETFYTDRGTRTVKMMKIVHKYEYTESTALDAQLIMLPFQGEEASMLIILPKSKNGLRNVIETVTNRPHHLGSAIAAMKKRKMLLSLPRFTVAATLDLGAVYKLLGVDQIFEDGGLTRLADEKHVRVSKAVQKTLIRVDEFGAEGAAASGVNIELIKHEIPQVMKADHPFFFMLLAGGEQLFSGVYAGNPD